MKDTYKKRLYTQVLSLSAATLLAVLAQGNVAADTLNPTEAPQEASPVSSLVENPTPVSAEKTEEHSDQPQADTADKENQPVAESDKTTSETATSPATGAENKKETLKTLLHLISLKHVQQVAKTQKFSLRTVRFICLKKQALRKPFKNKVPKPTKLTGHLIISQLASGKHGKWKTVPSPEILLLP